MSHENNKCNCGKKIESGCGCKKEEQCCGSTASSNVHHCGCNCKCNCEKNKHHDCKCRVVKTQRGN